MLSGSFDIFDDNLHPPPRARCHIGDPCSHHDPAAGSGRGELYEAQQIVDLMVMVGRESNLVNVKILCPIDVGYGDFTQASYFQSIAAIYRFVFVGQNADPKCPRTPEVRACVPPRLRFRPCGTLALRVSEGQIVLLHFLDYLLELVGSTSGWLG